MSEKSNRDKLMDAIDAIETIVTNPDDGTCDLLIYFVNTMNRLLAKLPGRENKGHQQDDSGPHISVPVLKLPVVSESISQTKVKESAANTVATGLINKETDSEDNNRFFSQCNIEQYCQVCRQDGVLLSCDYCPRTYHKQCVDDHNMTGTATKKWMCPHCVNQNKSPETSGQSLDDYQSNGTETPNKKAEI
ncbi:chromodomain-helicase-DNA-binding protein Mi-2 homolog [Oppia nitens]|uniref:chromodomain-helicase-DNA-binding protein Mi-2 homolog n=1 Tax=Oppia nitens TaxID=1686743 RepID=UPI0023DB46E7|nr:chromodomain-helicase-DNA-binding protein Mi-2 homolog [Oppia nitens]